MDRINTGSAKTLILSKRNKLRSTLARVVKSNRFSYKDFGTQIEPFVSDFLVLLFREKGFIQDKTDYHLAKDKNEFPDFTLKSVAPNLALEYKVGSLYGLKGGKWVKRKNSNNDMGTIFQWPQKINKFGGANIFYIFIIYDFKDKEKKIVDIQIRPFYQFLGFKNGILKYREKDGNLRPLDFDNKPQINSLDQFKMTLEKTAIYRSRRIIKKHQIIVKEVSQKGLF